MFALALGLVLLLTGAVVEKGMEEIDKAYNEERRFFEETL